MKYLIAAAVIVVCVLVGGFLLTVIGATISILAAP